MNIVLYETEHFETLATLVRVLDTGINQLQLLVPDALRDPLGALGVSESNTVSFRPLSQHNKHHPAQVKQACKESGAGLLVLATVSFRHAGFAAVSRSLWPQTRTVLGVHDVHDLFEPKRNSGLRGWFRYRGKRLLRQAVWGFTVLLDEMRDYVRNRYRVAQPVIVIPGSIMQEESAAPALGEAVSLLIPGSIDSRRRNYDAAKQLLQQSSTGWTLTIIGAATASTLGWIRDAQDLTVISGDFVPVADYEAALAAAEIIWAPLPRGFESDAATEHYGITKSSGVFFDAIRHGKPLLLPDHIPVPELLSLATLTYHDHDDLFYLLDALAGNLPARQRLRQLARVQAAKLSLDAVRARVLPLLTGGG